MSNVSRTTTAGRVRTEERTRAINRAHPWDVSWKVRILLQNTPLLPVSRDQEN